MRRAVRAAREEVKEESGRHVERHVLEAEREGEEDARGDLAPAHCDERHGSPQRERERDAIVLKVAVVDEKEARLEQH
jgi:hypothetical protein